MINLINDNFMNFENYNIEKAQLILTDIPYNIGLNAYASNPKWWTDDKSFIKSEKANTKFFETDENFKIEEFLYYCKKTLKKMEV